MRTVLSGLVLGAALGWPGLLAADVIHLNNGSRLEVEAWRDAGDAIEFASGGGVVRIAKSEVRRIEGKASRGHFRMYSSGVAGGSPGDSSGPTGALEKVAAAKRMAELLREGEALFNQGALTSNEKASAFRRLGERWREFEVPEPLREAYTRGQNAFQRAAEAFSIESQSPGDGSPEVRARLDGARAEIQGAQDDVRKAEAAG
jgi:hypothetical protein